MPTLSADQLVRLAYLAGWRDVDVITAVAVAFAESGGDPAAFNGNSATGDRSFGLWQVNMLGDLGPARLREFHLQDPRELWSPAVNAHAAWLIWRDADRKFTPWSTFKRGDYRAHLAPARHAFLDSHATYPEHAHNGPAVVLRRLLHEGENGLDVRLAQEVLGAKPDGIFGPITRGRVVLWQKGHHLSPDGVIGPETCAALGWTWKP